MDTLLYPSVTNFIDELNLDKIDRKIYDYILNHKDCNENDVRYSKVCSQRWARIKLWRLVKKGIIEHTRIGNGFHKFRVSDRTLVNRINKQLQYIETQIVIFKRPLLNMAELQDKVGPAAVTALVIEFQIPFLDSMFTMLYRLLEFSEDNEISKDDSLMLHTKILSLIGEVTNQLFYNRNYKQQLTLNKNKLNALIQKETTEPGRVKIGLRVENLERLVKRIEEFEEKF